MLQCVILAGGLGTRMKDWTQDRPKALIPIHDRPFVRYQMEWLKKTGVTHLTFSIGHLGEQIEKYVSENPLPGLEVNFVYERGELLGTGGALRHLLDQGALQPTFAVLYGDSYLPLNVGDVARAFQRQPLPALMTVFKNHGRFDKSNTNYLDGKVIFYSKTRKVEPMDYIDYGLSILSSKLIEENFKKGEKADLAALYERLSEHGQLAGLEVFERFYEIGSPQGLHEFSDYARSLSLKEI